MFTPHVSRIIFGGPEAVVRPDPIPNSAVKHSLADGSSPIGSARVGSRQSFKQNPRRMPPGVLICAPRHFKVQTQLSVRFVPACSALPGVVVVARLLRIGGFTQLEFPARIQQRAFAGGQVGSENECKQKINDLHMKRIMPRINLAASATSNPAAERPAALLTNLHRQVPPTARQPGERAFENSPPRR